MSNNKETFTNCFGEEMTRQIDEVEKASLGITITKDELNILEEALQYQYDSIFENDREMLQEEINKANCDWGFASSICFQFQQVHDAFKLIENLKERINNNGVEEKEKDKSGTNGK
jgi:hypothetical protein